jgi:precorrin-8X/cobalt-precorrin-8 methylmutase
MAPVLFDRVVIVDWSAAGQPKTGRDSIWICHRGGDGEHCLNPATRHCARLLLAGILAAAIESGERVLLGFDFPFGYPAGFAARLGLAGTPWRALWDELALLLHDGEDNRNDRFVVGAALNRRVSGGRFPFWGCPPSRAGEFLGPRHHRGHGADPLAERRLIDRWMVGAQPCWKLAYTGSVGSQALTGIPVVRSLRDDPRWADRARVWPFETGLRTPDKAQIVFAEVWPSWWRGQIRPDYGPPNDRAQVRSVAEIFVNCDRAGELARWFAGDPNLTADQRRIVETEEAWTLGVTTPRRQPGPAVPCTAAADRKRGFAYLRDPAAIYRRSFALIRAEAALDRFPASLRPLALRLAHAAGDTTILDDLAFSRGAAVIGRRALTAGAPILVDSGMVEAGIARHRLPAHNPVVCTLHDPATSAAARHRRTTRSAAAIELWRPHLAGAIVAIGNAPTALFRLLELLADGAARPALVLGFPVGFVGAAEAKEALIAFSSQVAPALPYVTLRGRRGGSALAAAAVNALCGSPRARPPGASP